MATARLRKPVFRFDEELHRFTVDGNVVRGVTGLIRDGGLVPADAFRFFTDEARWRGTRVHKACLDIDLDSFSGHASVDDAGYIESYLKWRHLVVPRWKILEEPRYSKRFRFCGVPDRVGFDGRGRPLVLDFKTGGPQHWHRYQLALYDLLCDDIPWGLRRRVTLHLQKDGSLAKAKEHDDRTDYNTAFRLLDAA